MSVNSTQPAIKVSNLCFRFQPTADDLLTDVSFDVQPGEIVAVVGKSGSGKSTLQNLLTGFLRPTGGLVSAFGHPVLSPRRERFAMSQDSGLFPWLTVSENIELALLQTSKTDRAPRIAECLKMVGLSDFKDHLPRRLSGGMSKRAEMARAIALGADILFLDEPFGALDSLTRETVRRELLLVWRRLSTTVLFITHDLAEAYELSDRILVLAGKPAKIKGTFGRMSNVPRDSLGQDFFEFKNKVLELLERS